MTNAKRYNRDDITELYRRRWLAELDIRAIKDNLGEVGNRPDRIEPRAVKRRPKAHALLTRPRREAREALLAGRG